MKTTKRIVSLLLVMTLFLSIATPTAFAQEGVDEIDWSELYFNEVEREINIRYGDSFTLRVDVNIPEGVEVEYQWFKIEDILEKHKIIGATGPELSLKVGQNGYTEYNPAGLEEVWYTCQVTPFVKDSEGNRQPAYDHVIKSPAIRVTTSVTLLGYIASIGLIPFLIPSGLLQVAVALKRARVYLQTEIAEKLCGIFLHEVKA